MSGDSLANHIRYREMVKARSEAADRRAKMGEKHPDFQDQEGEDGR